MNVSVDSSPELPQRFIMLGRVWSAADEAGLQKALAEVHHHPLPSHRPRCLCVPEGVEMYVAGHHQRFILKRMPGTGSRHHPGCPSYELEAGESGLGELIGQAVIEHDDGLVELRIDFPWTRVKRQGVLQGESSEPGEVRALQRRMSLRALMHFLFDRAGLNRWTPAMRGRRNQGVLHKYLLEAAAQVSAKGIPLGERLYVPEPFHESTRFAAAGRRRAKLAVLRPQEHQHPLALVIGEFKQSDVADGVRRVWIKHMPDAPLIVAKSTWDRVEKTFAPLFEAQHADTGHRARLIIGALVRSRREYTYEIDVASLMLTSEDWIPLDAVYELPLVHALVVQGRRFVKPLRYDATSQAVFANALLLDMGPTPVPLYVVSPFMTPKQQESKERVGGKRGESIWLWRTDTAMPAFPEAARR